MDARLPGEWASHGARAVVNPGVYFGLLLMAILVLGAYQVRPSYDITVGSKIDGPYLVGFNDREHMQGENPLPFRWTTGDSHIVLAGVGKQDFDVILTLSGNRPAGAPPAQMSIEAAGRKLFEGTASPDLIEYKLQVPRELVADGTLDMHLVTNPFTPPGDTSNRMLGVTVTNVKVVPGANPDRFIAPPGDVMASLLGAVALLGLVLALLGWGGGAVAVGTGLVALLAAGLLVFDRLWLTSGQWYEAWPQAVLLGGVFILIVDLVARFFFRRSSIPWQGMARRGLLTVMLMVFAVRLAVQFHPQIFIVDLLFHVHRFEIVESGQLLFMTQPAEWANYPTFYLPTTYIVMLPLQWLLGDMASVIRITMVAFGTAGAVLLYYVACSVLRDRRAGVLAGTLYLVFPISVLLFSWGILTNIFGDFFALATFALLVGAGDSISPRRPAFWGLLFVLTVALLSHPGTVQMVSVAVGVFVLLSLPMRRRLGSFMPAVWGAAALALSWAVSYAIYYQHFLPGMVQTLGDISRERASQSSGGIKLRVGGGIADRSLGLVSSVVYNWGDWLTGGLNGFWNEARAYYRAWPIVGALFAYIAVWPRRGATRQVDQARVRLVLAAVAWTVAVVIFAAAGWVLNLYVRYALFALPVIALGSGILLSFVWRRGRLGAWLALLVVLFFAVEALGLWQYRINYGLK